MALTDYPELQGAPEECDFGPLPREPVVVSVPYNGLEVEEAVMLQPSLLPVDHPAFVPLERLVMGAQMDNLDSATIGYDSDAENDALGKLRQLASSLRNNTAFYEPSIREDIVELASMARDFLNQIEETYATFESDEWTKLTPKKSGGRPPTPRNYPLSVNDFVIEQQIDPNENDPFWSYARQQARLRIRGLWDRVLHDLWCAQVGANQSRSYRANRQAWTDQQPDPVAPGSGLVLPGTLPQQPRPAEVTFPDWDVPEVPVPVLPLPTTPRPGFEGLPGSVDPVTPELPLPSRPQPGGGLVRPGDWTPPDDLQQQVAPRRRSSGAGLGLLLLGVGAVAIFSRS